MDYEKAYKEALEDMRVIYPNLKGDAKLAVEHAFPQLRESEDERIRKELIAFFKDGISTTVAKKDIVSWLEKQKEHHIPWYDYQKSKEAGYTIVPNEEYEQLIKQKEQKPEDKEITLTNFEEVLNTFLFDFANSPIEDCEPKEYTKKHSAEILKAAYAELNAQLKQDIFEAQQEGRREGYEAAKAEQKPAEWSEEDGTIIEGACNALEIHGHTKLAERLKSLRPQPKGVFEQAVRAIYEMCHSYRNKGIFTDERACDFMGNVRLKCKDAIECSPILDEPRWKPSEEQMGALNYAYCELFKREDIEHNILGPLQRLCDDLKKL